MTGRPNIHLRTVAQMMSPSLFTYLSKIHVAREVETHGVLLEDVLEFLRIHNCWRIAAVDTEDFPSLLARAHPMRIVNVDEDADLPMVEQEVFVHVRPSGAGAQKKMARRCHIEQFGEDTDGMPSSLSTMQA